MSEPEWSLPMNRAELIARVEALEAALRTVAEIVFSDSVEYDDLRNAQHVIDTVLPSAQETACEPLPKLECGMGCGRTFCSPEGRDHHEELCEGPTSKTTVKP
jgi:hypothetical protein